MAIRYIPGKRASTLLMAAAFAASWWQPLWPVEQRLHSILTIAAAVTLWAFVRKYGMDIAVHCLATH